MCFNYEVTTALIYEQITKNNKSQTDHKSIRMEKMFSYEFDDDNNNDDQNY